MPFGQNGAKDKEWASMGGIAKAAIYELDRMQLERMRKVVDKDLEIIERIQEQEEINPLDEKKLQIAQSRVQKYLDKLHATKNSMGADPDNPLSIKVINEIATKNGISDTSTINDSKGQTPIQSS